MSNDTTSTSAELPNSVRIAMKGAGAILLLLAPLLHAAGIARDSTLFLMGGGIALLIFGAMDRLESFTAWGVSAKLRAAEKAAEEAMASASEVRQLALSMMRLALGLAHAGGRMDGNRRVRHLVNRDIDKLVEDLKVSVVEQRQVFREITTIALHDLGIRARHAAFEAADNDAKPAMSAEAQRFEEAWSRGESAPSAAELRDWATKHNAMSEAVEAALRQLEEAEQAVADGQVIMRRQVL
ncbi:MAG: hypothetical protein K2X11_02570 [Acetobacteraceae bacterium]|nr:hypothetical protein [Acetobacteraceae bacterium]